MMKGQQVYFVTYPRSGHKALVRFMDHMAGIGDDYCEFYNCINHKGIKHKCIYENYNWINKHFRCGAGKRLLKNHDFDLGLPIRNDVLYVIQYRHPFKSISSWYEMDVERNHDIPEWDIYLRVKLEFWIKFMRKWVQGNLEKSNFFFIQYENLGDREKLEDLVRFIGSNVKRQLEPGYYVDKRSLHCADSIDRKTLRLYEEKISPVLKMAGVNRLFKDEEIHNMSSI